MRARPRHLLAVLVTAISVVLSAAPASSASASPSVVQDVHNCPRGTSWDNLLHRCV